MYDSLESVPIRFEADADPTFARFIQDRSGCEDLTHCIQCGTCSGTCPSANYMEHNPRKVMALIKAGFKEDVLTSFTPWLCASCYSCMVQCPKRINITEIMYAIKQTALEQNKYPKKFPSPVMVQEFFKSVAKRGRLHEGLLIFNLFLKTNRVQFFKQGWFGFNMWRKGLLHIMPDSIRQKKDMETLLKSMDESAA